MNSCYFTRFREVGESNQEQGRSLQDYQMEWKQLGLLKAIRTPASHTWLKVLYLLLISL